MPSTSSTQPLLRALARVAVWIAVCTTATAAERGTLIRDATCYISPDIASAKLGTVGRGREAVLLERTQGWVHVIATLADAPYNPDPDASQGRTLTGWMLDKGYISESTANGDQILFGEAADSEDEASRSHGRKNAADDARRLYYRVYDLFSKSPLAAEALYRSADVQWQLDREDLQSRPSRKELDPQQRPTIDEEAMRLVHKTFPGSRWDDLAAYELLENKFCGEWARTSQDALKCSEHDAEIYEKYAADHPNSPKDAEASYNAAFRWATTIAIFAGEGQSGKTPAATIAQARIAEAKKRAIGDARRALEKNASPEWNARTQRLLYMVEHNIPASGAPVE